MKLKEMMTTTGWLLVAGFLLGSFGAGIYLINVASAKVDPPDDQDIKVALKTNKNRKGRSKPVMNARRTPKLSPKTRVMGIAKNLSLSKGKKKLNLGALKGAAMPGTGHKPLALTNMAGPKREEDAKDRTEYDNIKKDRRLQRDKRRYEKMDERISRLEQRLEALKNDSSKSAQAKRLEKSIERLKTRKLDLQKRLKEAGEIQ